MLFNPIAPAPDNLTTSGKPAASGTQAMPIGCVRPAAQSSAAGHVLRPACKTKVCPGTCRHKRPSS